MGLIRTVSFCKVPNLLLCLVMALQAVWRYYALLLEEQEQEPMKDKIRETHVRVFTNNIHETKSLNLPKKKLTRHCKSLGKDKSRIELFMKENCQVY